MSSENCTSGSASCHFTCPAGGTWYVCPDEPYFVGCCSSDPCTNSNTTSPCPDVYAASFEPSIFDSIRPNTCIGAANNNWYTCNFTDPPFLGCCSSGACDNTDGCPADDVLAAGWSSSRGDQLELFEDEGEGGGDGGGGDDDDGLSGGAIAGIVVGCVAGLALVLLAAWFLVRRRKQKKVAAGGGVALGTPSIVEGEQQRMYPGEYGYQNPTSPYQDSFSSPAGTTVGGKYPSGTTGFSPSLSPPMPSESGRPISELYSNNGSEGGGQHHNQGLGLFGVQKPAPIQELDSTAKPPEVHELDGGSRS
ncbi:hypothetical protein BJX76DRAFT_106081 [Aspergillus varians]